jgi:erythronate-4-phosphate dehydrogenase
LKIVADSNILFIEDAVSGLGELVLYKTRIEDKSILKNADALLCRSTMKINGELLENSGVKFVATATSGTEHFDTGYLEHKNIKYTDAKGSNSNSVSEYVVAALLNLAVKNKFSLKNKSIGIVGWGCVGKKVEKKAEALGLKVFVNDPPLEDMGERKIFSSLEEILKCDIVTLHIPLIKTGKYKTEELFSNEKFSVMKKGSIFINASRGKVVNEKALRDAFLSGRIAHAVLDVWQNEPGIDTSTLDCVDIATQHIAGHSFDGKALGTAMILKEFCSYFNVAKDWNYSKLLPPCEFSEIIAVEKENDEELFYDVVKKLYDIDFDDSLLREIKQQENKNKYFDSLRGNYRIRREFFNTTVFCKNESLKNKFNQLGFNVK